MSAGPDGHRGGRPTAPGRRSPGARRRASAGAGSGATFRRQRAGMIGLAILIVFVLIAILAPLLADSSGLDVTRATGEPIQPPYSGYPLGTDEYGPLDPHAG